MLLLLGPLSTLNPDDKCILLIITSFSTTLYSKPLAFDIDTYCYVFIGVQ